MGDRNHGMIIHYSDLSKEMKRIIDKLYEKQKETQC
jgi:6-pyruvoyl-tetrahydropterin synthase